VEKRQPLQKFFLGKLDICMQKTETRSILSRRTSTNLKWIKDFSIRPETLKTAHERVGDTLEAIGIDNDFLNQTQVA
jgi:hypothetical protein